jgi:hypothetical protein
VSRRSLSVARREETGGVSAELSMPLVVRDDVTFIALVVASGEIAVGGYEVWTPKLAIVGGTTDEDWCNREDPNVVTVVVGG